MKPGILAGVVFAAVAAHGADLPDFRPQPIVTPLLLSRQTKVAPAIVPIDVMNRADAEFRRIVGGCGDYSLWGKIADTWLFTTRVGYGGAPGPVFVIKEGVSDDQSKRPNQAVEPLPTTVTFPAAKESRRP